MRAFNELPKTSARFLAAAIVLAACALDQLLMSFVFLAFGHTLAFETIRTIPLMTGVALGALAVVPMENARVAVRVVAWIALGALFATALYFATQALFY
ncbi:hypothetical protein G7Y31_02290 [Corynebacterium lizhenjunii]|uniref:Uncharacterized protein n=1 Tax=Corynebacterium lizhenjunii TaxID=2709394 RepID=A0A7T0PAX8_9CORY|nr:hypothetical protein [Corynebacterium lizhenjunii]QPK79561.1 hypothetical protein G7Y31_02290 [Corynebacterium lizhenjunii]